MTAPIDWVEDVCMLTDFMGKIDAAFSHVFFGLLPFYLLSRDILSTNTSLCYM